ncbi:LytR/AlgR family response regulator transcription factor [Flavobacterium saccharophilum]|uniref:Two component transcriptional regulator, LytTR family n=1 Tax=Flavobacterium saccharophilum TaxID=29534 RepID=A0A1M7MKX9_9FLAO|nr:LytTR family DNA-binding domain-containing protein [Flavobacterium saccharophilum]SHM91524.1 two component transcriptional regulator, LytTR family [Flavobacterium saccharophilum]
MKIKAIIVDDESRGRSLLKNICSRYFPDKIEIVDECNSVATALISIKKNAPNLVFLDIQMPDKNGFELLTHFEIIPFEIIFTTAHKEYAIEAIRKSALDYLVKPIDVQDFKTAIGRFESVLENKTNLNRYELLTENLSHQTSGKQRIAFPTKTGFEVIHVNKIIFCKSDGSYTIIYTKESQHHTSKSFKEICELLQSEIKFLKVHRSYLINAEYVKNFKSDDYVLEMTSGHEIPVSDKSFNKKELIDAITK